MRIELPKFLQSRSPEKFPEHFTPLVRIPEFCVDFGNANLWVKDESAHGSWKERKARYVAEQVEGRGVTKVVVITAGNAGPAIAEQLRPKGVPVVAIIDPRTSDAIKETLRHSCHAVVEQDLSQKLTESEIIALARENPDEVIWNVTEGCEEGYETIVEEILQQTKGVHPEYIFCPFGQGEAFAGLMRAVERRAMDTIVVGVKPNGRTAFADKLDTGFLPPYASSYFDNLEHANIMLVSDPDIRDAYEYAKRHIRCEPSSAIVFARPVREHFYYTRFDKNRNPRRPSIIINSGGE